MADHAQDQPGQPPAPSARQDGITTTSGALEPSVQATGFTASGRMLPAVPGSASVSQGVTRRRRRTRMQALSMLPSMLTLGNGVCGISAVIELFKAYLAMNLSHIDQALWHMNLAAVLIGGGMVFDALDGKVARLTNTSGKFGAELDSLCDAVSFGLAPAMLTWTFGQYLYGSGDYQTKGLWTAAVLYACCAILRLARFNAETEPDDDHMTFSGLPSPGAACGVVSMFLALSWFSARFDWMQDAWATTLLAIALPVLTGAYGLLMVTRIRYVHFMNRLFNRRQSFRALILVLLVVALLAIFADYWQLIVPAGVIIYTLSGPVYLAYRWLRGRGVLGRRMQFAERQKQHRERLARMEREAAREATA